MALFLGSINEFDEDNLFSIVRCRTVEYQMKRMTSRIFKHEGIVLEDTYFDK